MTASIIADHDKAIRILSISLLIADWVYRLVAAIQTGYFALSLSNTDTSTLEGIIGAYDVIPPIAIGVLLTCATLLGLPRFRNVPAIKVDAYSTPDDPYSYGRVPTHTGRGPPAYDDPARAELPTMYDPNRQMAELQHPPAELHGHHPAVELHGQNTAYELA